MVSTGPELTELAGKLAQLASASRELAKQADELYSQVNRAIDESDSENRGQAKRAQRIADQARKNAVQHLKQVDYFWRQAHWLTSRFLEGKLRDVQGLVKLVDRDEIAANDFSLTPGRYVGVAPEEEDPDFGFGQAMHEIHEELRELDQKAAELAKTIQRNFEGLGL